MLTNSCRSYKSSRFKRCLEILVQCKKLNLSNNCNPQDTYKWVHLNDFNNCQLSKKQVEYKVHNPEQTENEEM